MPPTEQETTITLVSLLNAGRHDIAETHCRLRLKDAPEDAALWRMLGSILGIRGDVDGALSALEQALVFKPTDVPALLAAGTTLHKLMRFEEACDRLRHARECEPDNVRILTGLGQVCCVLGRMDEAREAYEAALKLDPVAHRARLGLSHALFALGDWAAGWAAYDSRLDLHPVLPAGLPAERRWRGGAVPSSLAVFAEQGLGDAILFSRFLPELARMGCDVTFIVDPRLFAVLRSLHGRVSFHSRNEPFQFKPGQMWAPLLSLPGVMGRGPEGLAPNIPYLEAERSRVTKWRDRLGQQGFKIGICWQGAEKGRSMPLRTVSPLAALPDVRLISLQKGPGEEQIADTFFKVETLGNDFDSGPDAFVDTAAVMMCLDHIVTVDTAVAHMAGALARPVSILLKRYDADWRWLIERDDTPWYPTARLVRQNIDGDWSGAVRQVCTRLSSTP